MSRPILRNLGVVGLFYRDTGTKDRIRRAVNGTYPAKLVPDPLNAQDPYAVQVHVKIDDAGEVFAGFIPASCSALVAYWLEAAEPFYATVEISPDKSLPKLNLNVSLA